MVAVTFFPVAEAAPLGEEPEVEAFPRSVRSGQNSHSISYDTSLPLTTVFMSLPLPAIVLQALSESDCDREASEKSGPKKSSRSRRKGWGVWGSHESGESDGTSSSTPTRTSLSLSRSLVLKRLHQAIQFFSLLSFFMPAGQRGKQAAEPHARGVWQEMVNRSREYEGYETLKILFQPKIL